MGHLLEVQDVIIEALAKVKELFGEKSVICSSYKMAYISVLMERRENEKAYEEIQKLIPIVRECEGEVCAKEIEMMQIRVLAQMGREEEALELGEKMRPFIRQVGGDEWGLMKALDRTINNVKTGVYRPKTSYSQDNGCKFGCNECTLLDNTHCRRIMESGILHSDNHFLLYGIFCCRTQKKGKIHDAQGVLCRSRRRL